jgi:DNA modification methylase
VKKEIAPDIFGRLGNLDTLLVNGQLTGARKRSVNRLAVHFASKNGNGNGQAVCKASRARYIAKKWIEKNIHGFCLSMGLPEVDDRYEAWRVALLSEEGQVVGELMISCSDGEVVQATKINVIMSRLTSKKDLQSAQAISQAELNYTHIGDSVVVCGDARIVLRNLPKEAFGLVITSPPYYNAKPQYSEYSDYEEYLSFLKQVFQECHRTLKEGRFIIVNASPVLVRRPSRNKSSKRIPVPFHINNILEEIGFEFLDDIIWAKPAGAGWNTGRGRRFAADRNPLQYKPVPVTEYFLVYRKKTDKLIDWNIRQHPDQQAVKQSRVKDGYEVTNLWHEKPSHHPQHPATFPVEIIDKLINYYSFRGDIVLDPFAGIGTVGKAALNNGRLFYLIDIEPNYCQTAVRELSKWHQPMLSQNLI